MVPFPDTSYFLTSQCMSSVIKHKHEVLRAFLLLPLIYSAFLQTTCNFPVDGPKVIIRDVGSKQVILSSVPLSPLVSLVKREESSKWLTGSGKWEDEGEMIQFMEHYKLTLLYLVIKESKIYLFFPFTNPLKFTLTHIKMLWETFTSKMTE